MSDLFAVSLRWMDERWDADAGLLVNPSQPEHHAVRETVWYALGLLSRGDHADVKRARRALAVVLVHQFDEPGTPWHGTFRRAPEEPLPVDGAIEWIHYDPNWRQFIGTTLAVIESDFPELLGAELRADVNRAIGLAVEGEPPERIGPEYTNIALLKSWLDVHAGHRYAEDSWIRRGEDLAIRFAERTRAEGGVDEYNSPTYAGVDLHGLALWRRSPSATMAALGEELEAELWRDLASMYHPGLRNLCGPWLRSYGADMNTYLAQFGLFVWPVVGPAAAPVPDTEQPFEHAHDFAFGPLVALVPTRPPADAADRLRELGAPRTIDKTVAGRRVTADLDHGWMTGGLVGGPVGNPQTHPATAHWRPDDGGIGWLRARSRGRLDAVAGPRSLEIECDADITVETSGPDAPVRYDRDGAPDDSGGRFRVRFTPGPLRIDLTVDP